MEVNLLNTLEKYPRPANRIVDCHSERSKFQSLKTGGSIYRLAVIRKVGEFDEKMKVNREDFDAEMRIRAWGECKQ